LYLTNFKGKKKAKHHRKHVQVIEPSTTKVIELIPKPYGSAGKTPPHGYNLQAAMGLTDNK
jgi:hypothetical protein